MGKTRNVSPEREAEMLQRYRDGDACIDIEMDYGIDGTTLYAVIHRNGVSLRGHGFRNKAPKIARRNEPKPIPPDTIERIRWLNRVQKLTSLRIAPLVRLPYREVERIIEAG